MFILLFCYCHAKKIHKFFHALTQLFPEYLERNFFLVTVNYVRIQQISQFAKSVTTTQNFREKPQLPVRFSEYLELISNGAIRVPSSATSRHFHSLASRSQKRKRDNSPKQNASGMLRLIWDVFSANYSKCNLFCITNIRAKNIPNIRNECARSSRIRSFAKTPNTGEK